MDAYLGSYQTGSDSEDDEWMIAQLIEPLDSNSLGEESDGQQKNIRPEKFIGKVEYKWKLINPSGWRFNQLVSQVR